MKARSLCMLIVAAACGGSQPNADAAYDVVIRGGTVVDGSGAAPYRADVGIADGHIARIARDGVLDTAGVRIVLDADSLIVAPGFIDNHAHIATTIHRFPLAENFLRQGITTILASLHSGDQPWPLDQYATSLDVAPNVGFFAGHSWIRTRVLGLEDRAPNAAELDHMRALVDSTMRQGALGLSTGLLYVPAFYAKTEEVIELAKVASQHRGIYVTHMRDEQSGLLQS
ncbi:MAG: N-acyl-D-amino-acid deacylase family protein, partial [Gemmatimonadaceae bacterium]